MSFTFWLSEKSHQEDAKLLIFFATFAFFAALKNQGSYHA